MNIAVYVSIYIYIWCSRSQILPLLKYFVEDKGCMWNILLWHKIDAMPAFSNNYINDKEYCLMFREEGTKLKPKNYEYAKSIYTSPTNKEGNKQFKHPTVKPLTFIERMIYNSTNEGDVVLDTFAGSGTTLKACQNLNRQYIGFEKNEKYYQIAKDRLNNIQADGQFMLF